MIDNLNVLLTDTAGPLDFLEVLNELTSMPEGDHSITLALGINRDLFWDEQTIDFYRECKHSAFDMIFELNRNLSGYTKDVHGQLNIISNKQSLVQSASVKNVKFRLAENKVEIFEHFVL